MNRRIPLRRQSPRSASPKRRRRLPSRLYWLVITFILRCIFHRTTRGIEQLLTAFLQAVAAVVADGGIRSLCLSSDHPLAAYYAQQDPSLDLYLALDDTAVWSAIEAATRGSNQVVS